MHYFSSKKTLYHYISMAEGNYREYLQGEIVRVKKYFYVLRPVLACRWILDRGTPPPMLFSELIKEELPIELINGLVLSHYPIFSWKNMGRGKILLYGHTHESEEDRFYQNCLRQMQENDCRHVYDKKLWACNVGCMLPYMNYTPRTLAEILAGVEAET